MPLGRVRRQERGYNQVEEVARRALEELAMPEVRLDTALLTRARETPTQISLARAAREENMKGAFTAAAPANPPRLCIVLDDVLTTGATLQGALDALSLAGLPRDHLLPIALAH